MESCEKCVVYLGVSSLQQCLRIFAGISNCQAGMGWIHTREQAKSLWTGWMTVSWFSGIFSGTLDCIHRIQTRISLSKSEEKMLSILEETEKRGRNTSQACIPGPWEVKRNKSGCCWEKRDLFRCQAWRQSWLLLITGFCPVMSCKHWKQCDTKENAVLCKMRIWKGKQGSEEWSLDCLMVLLLNPDAANYHKATL